jgi:hypothetical protein
VAETDELLKKVRVIVSRIKRHLPDELDPKGLSPVKLAFAPLACREALIWRVAELGHSACLAFKRDDVGAGMLLTRAVIECSAATWYLVEKIENFKPEDYAGTDDIMKRLWLGSKTDPNVPDPINVLTMLRQANKSCPGICGWYDALSEFAHPNWGAQSLNREINYDTKVISFGHYPGDANNAGKKCLFAGLTAFEIAYNKISDLMPKYISNCQDSVPHLATSELWYGEPS